MDFSQSHELDGRNTNPFRDEITKITNRVIFEFLLGFNANVDSFWGWIGLNSLMVNLVIIL